MRVGVCSVVGCGRYSTRRGMCENHYRKALKEGRIPVVYFRGLPLQERLLRLSKVNPETGCIEWTGTTHRETGYGSTRINGKSTGTHRAAWIAANGQIPDGLHVLHKCDVRHCINPDHLFLGTNDDNVADMVAKGRNVIVRGEQKGNSKLNDELVRRIRVDCRTHREIADELGVGHTIIGLVKQQKIWRHVD